MTLLPLVVFSLAYLAQGSYANSTSSNCPPLEGNSRTLWNILRNCAVTLLICTWHAIHPDIPGFLRYDNSLDVALRVSWIPMTAFIAPELVVNFAASEWCKAHENVKMFRGYQWSISHSHFMNMGGFAYRNNEGQLEIMKEPEELRELCEGGKIANPLITEKDIKDRSKSNPMNKAIFMFQLFWFIFQVVARLSQGLAVTLIEIDTLCMAAVAFFYLLFWWDKPHRPKCPHVFRRAKQEKVYSREDLSKAWRSEPGYLSRSITCTMHHVLLIAGRKQPSPDDHSEPGKLTTMVKGLHSRNVSVASFFITWTILGGLHLIAWNFEFPTETEKILWRVASLVLAGCALVLACCAAADNAADFMGVIFASAVILVGVSCFVLGVASRLLLVGLMLASLRALPCSAYEAVSWVSYIPHL